MIGVVYALTEVGDPPSVAVGVQWIKGPDGILMPVWPKDPEELKDYSLNWTHHLLPDDTVVDCRHYLPSNDFYVLSRRNTGIRSFAWIAPGGVLQSLYYIETMVFTAKGRKYKRTWGLWMGTF